jgi:hypothetical protein
LTGRSEIRCETSVSRFQEKEKRGEMITKNDNINDNINDNTNDNIFAPK